MPINVTRIMREQERKCKWDAMEKQIRRDLAMEATILAREELKQRWLKYSKPFGEV